MSATGLCLSLLALLALAGLGLWIKDRSGVCLLRRYRRRNAVLDFYDDFPHAPDEGETP